MKKQIAGLAAGIGLAAFAAASAQGCCSPTPKTAAVLKPAYERAVCSITVGDTVMRKNIVMGFPSSTYMTAVNNGTRVLGVGFLVGKGNIEVSIVDPGKPVDRGGYTVASVIVKNSADTKDNFYLFVTTENEKDRTELPVHVRCYPA
jgi:hypothetical protein